MYIYIYICTYTVSSTFSLWFPSSTSFNVFVWFPSSVFCLWFPSWQEAFVYGFRRFCCCYGFRRGRKMLFYGFRRWIVGGFCRRRRIHNFRKYRAIPFLLVFRTGFRRYLFYGFRRGRETFVYGFRRWFIFHGFRRGKERFFIVSVVVFFLWFPAATGPRLSLRWKP